MSDCHLDRAVAPTLFDVVAGPELVFTLVLANLMSPRLWHLRERMLHAPGNTLPQVQELLDHHFEHVAPGRIAAMNGVLDLAGLEARYGAAAVEYARSSIASAFKWRVGRGTLKQDDAALELLGQGKFPAFSYATIDEAWACRRLLQHRKHKPLGLTCCLDEAAIFAALVLALGKVPAGQLAFLGGPSHFTAFMTGGDGGWWFYSKHVLLASSDWVRLVADDYGGDHQMAFDDRLPDFDRIITAAGSFLFASGETSLPQAHLDGIVAQIEAFFGFRPAQLDQALRRSARPEAGSDATSLVQEAASAADAREAGMRIHRAAHEDAQVTALRALYAFRSLDVSDLSVYLQAARYGSQVGALLPRIGTAADALQAVATVTGTGSIFEDPDRIAMPDETVRFGTGTCRDKALLLHVLLEHALRNDPAPGGVETLISGGDSFVRGAGFCISVSRLEHVPQPEGPILFRIADPPGAATP